MKIYTIIAALFIAILNGLVLVPALQPHAMYLVVGSLALALWLLLKAFTVKEIPAAREAAPEVAAPSAPTESPETRRQADAEALNLLGVFQSKGRLVDFLMDDIGSYSDAQVGAAARVVQQGCKAALEEHFSIVPVASEKEGSAIAVPEDAPADAYRLVGKVSGEPPYRGVLAHKGWQATSVKLPRVICAEGDRLPVIAPAQVEMRS